MLMKIYDESSSNFSFEFDGESEIDAKLLISTIDNLVDSLQYVTTCCDSDAYAKIKITSLRQGSFNIDFKAIVNFVSNLCNKFGNEVDFASKIIDIFTGAIEIKKHLKGKKPKDISYKDDKGIIINSDDEKLIKDKKTTEIYLENGKLDSNITNIFNIMLEDGTRTGVRIKSNGENIISIRENEFKDMSNVIVDDNIKVAEVLKNEINVNLLLKKPDLLGNSKWGFVLDKYIEATIEDEDWLKKVHTGDIALRAGVKVPARLRIESSLDKNRNVIATKYSVLEVIGDIIDSHGDDNEQLTLF